MSVNQSYSKVTQDNQDIGSDYFLCNLQFRDTAQNCSFCTETLHILKVMSLCTGNICMSHLFDCHFGVYVVIGEKRSVSFIKYLSGTGRMILGWYTRITPVLFYKLLRTVCAFEITRNMLYLQCCPTDTWQREEVSLYGNHHFFYCLLHGKHSRLLCLQMVRGRQVGQH